MRVLHIKKYQKCPNVQAASLKLSFQLTLNPLARLIFLFFNMIGISIYNIYDEIYAKISLNIAHIPE